MIGVIAVFSSTKEQLTEDDMNSPQHRATLLANNFLRLLPLIEANDGKQGPVTAAIYDDGTVIYVSGEDSLHELITSVLRDDAAEIGFSHDHSITVCVVTSHGWEEALDKVAAIVEVERSDNRQSDRPTIGDYIELIGRSTLADPNSDVLDARRSPDDKRA